MTNPPLQLWPAIDIKNGQAVRLTQGTCDTNDWGNPTDVATTFVAHGARCLHVVDLDAAFGTGTNRSQLAQIAATVDVPVQFSGGITDEHTVTWALDCGATWVNLSAAVLLDEVLLDRLMAQFPDRMSIAVDIRDGLICPRGTNQVGGPWQPAVAQAQAEGCTRFVVTDVTRDGAMTGPNLALLAEVQHAVAGEVLASGGVRDAADLAALRRQHVSGLVVGKTLYLGTLTMAEALAAAGPQNTDPQP